MRARLVRKVKILDDQIGRCNELAEQTQVLISLLFNIATLQDARAAVEESRAANEVAGSVRRVAVLTFVVLPLTLASVSTFIGSGVHAVRLMRRCRAFSG